MYHKVDTSFAGITDQTDKIFGWLLACGSVLTLQVDSMFSVTERQMRYLLPSVMMMDVFLWVMHWMLASLYLVVTQRLPLYLLLWVTEWKAQHYAL